MSCIFLNCTLHSLRWFKYKKKLCSLNFVSFLVVKFCCLLNRWARWCFAYRHGEKLPLPFFLLHKNSHMTFDIVKSSNMSCEFDGSTLNRETCIKYSMVISSVFHRFCKWTQFSADDVLQANQTICNYVLPVIFSSSE